jgi:cytohesin
MLEPDRGLHNLQLALCAAQRDIKSRANVTGGSPSAPGIGPRATGSPSAANARDGSESSAQNVDRNSRDINEIVKKACDNQNGAGTIVVINNHRTYKVALRKEHRHSQPKIMSVKPLTDRDVAPGNAVKMEALQNARAIPDEELSRLFSLFNEMEEAQQAAIGQAESHVNTIIRRVHGSNSQLTEEECKMIKGFIECGLINVNHASSGRTLLDMAVRGNSLPMVEYLDSKGIDMNRNQPGLDTPAQAAIRTKKDKAIVEYLLNKIDVDPKRKGACQQTLMETAICVGNGDVLVRLLSKYDRNQLNEPNDAGLTPLMIAVKEGNRDMAGQLTEKGADPNVLGAQNNTALLLAAGAGNSDMMEFLMEKGADAAIVNDAGFTAEQLLREVESQKHDRAIGNQLMALLRPGMPPEDIGKVKELIGQIQNGDHLNTEYRGGEFILAEAIANGDREMVELLIEKGVRIDILDVYLNGPLATAMVKGDRDMMEFLFNKVKEKGQPIAENPALQASVLAVVVNELPHPELLDFLVAQGIDVVDAKIRTGFTLLKKAEVNLKEATQKLKEGKGDSQKIQQEIEKLNEVIALLKTQGARSSAESAAAEA